jgi:DHA1 family bicyclomycin/chloramphenicol resistance-like MFS transporter
MGFGLMLAACAVNLLYSALAKASAPWAIVLLWPVAYGWALVVPAVTILVLDSFPTRRGMASSLQSFVGGTTNGLVAGVLTPLVMGSTLKLAAAAMLLSLAGVAFWLGAKRLTAPARNPPEAKFH